MNLTYILILILTGCVIAQSCCILHIYLKAIPKACRDADDKAERIRSAFKKALESTFSQLTASVGVHTDDIAKLNTAVSQLMGGVIPDYEQAKAATKAINDFNTGITNILGFDPVKALRKSEESENN